jgi:hypothetical protein
MNNDLPTYLVGLETSLMDARVRNSDKAAQLLDDAYLEIGSTGMTYNKAQVVAALKKEPPRSIKAQDFKVQEFVPGLVLVTYTCQHGEPEISTMRSSVWQLWGGKWKLVFHQGTRIIP